MLPIDQKELIFMIGELSIENKQLRVVIKKLSEDRLSQDKLLKDRPAEGKPSSEDDSGGDKR